MSKKIKQLSNPISTGGGGVHFEAHIQSSFVVLMLTGGYAPCLPCWPIKKVKLQGKIEGYDTDDLIVVVENEQTGESRKLLGQVKRSIAFTTGNEILGEVLFAAWSDFNNQNLFDRKKDVIALITGPVSATDQQNVQWILNHAKQTNSSIEFYRDVRQANFSPSKAEEKLNVLRYHLKNANNGSDVSNDDLYEFINRFYLLGYDIGGDSGVVLPLLHSHISQFQKQNVKMVWRGIVDFVQTRNQHAGTITLDKLPDDIVELFKQKTIIEQMPVDLKPIKVTEGINWQAHPNRYELSIIILLGGWNEKNVNDTVVLSKLLSTSYEEWLPKARDILHQPDSPLTLKNGIWTVTRKEELLSLLGSQILDLNIESFKKIATEVLKEQNPAFDLPEDQRYAASIHGKVLKHSGVIRQGIAEGVALLGSQSKEFTNCSIGKPEATALLIVRELFNEASWQQWASLNNLLPDLAEAAPAEFLNQIDSALLTTPCVFDDIFAQEGTGLTGGNHLTGLLWALEGLAWEEQYLVRICCILAELAAHDPGGSWANRPANSIATILLPWLPQTLASIEKRKVAVKTIVAETPKVGWKLLLQLLPGQHTTSSGSHKPKWRKTIPADWEKGVSHEEYWNQISSYAELIVDTAKKNFERQSELINYFGSLTKPAFDDFIDHLASAEIQKISDENKHLLWEKLNRFTLKHRKFSDSDWALPSELLIRIEDVAKKLAPIDPFNLYKYLFSDRDFDLYEEKGNWEEERAKLDKKRQEAVKALLSEGGLECVIEFIDAVLSPREVGHALGVIADNDIDEKLLPAFLGFDNQKSNAFIAAYLWRRRYLQGWEWTDNLQKSNWTKEQLGQFLSYLPFEQNTWQRANSWLQDSENEYWIRTSANGYETDDDQKYAIEKLIQYGRPIAALNCINRLAFSKKPIDSDQCIRALMASVKSSEPAHTMDQYNIVELIKHLQSDSSIDEADLFRVEWVYLPLLDGYSGAEPTLLEHKLANDPNFFCELIQLIYRSNNDGVAHKEPSEDKKAIAENAWKLLFNWHTPPGFSKDGNFNSELFKTWLTRVKEECRKSGHYEVAMLSIGNVLIHAPKDETGLWIHRDIASALNDKEAEDMRRGYSISTFNSRGAHMVDPTGKPEKELAEQFRQKADSVENEGYHRFSVTLKGIADDYERQAERIISDYSDENQEPNTPLDEA